MNARTRKSRKLLRTTFTVFTLLFLAGFLTTGWFSCLYTDPYWNWTIKVSRGSTSILVPSKGMDKLVDYLGPGFHEAWHGDFDLDLSEWPPFAGYFAQRSSEMRISLWLPAVLLLFANAFWYWRDWRKRRRPDFCQNCGYNLRATPDRCPECGMVGGTPTPE